MSWPGEPLAHQLDGIETGPVRTGGSRQATGSFAPCDGRAVTEVRARVQAVPASRPVIVVTDEPAVAHEAWADGANVLAGRLFLAVVGRPVAETR